MAASCFDKACELLARRAHFRRELERKLADRGYPRQEIADALGRLTESGYLDDGACALALAEGRLARRGYGPRRMRHELARRGAPEDAVDAALAHVFADGDRAPALAAARRWLATHAPDRPALARHLERKGFHSATVIRVSEELTGR